MEPLISMFCFIIRNSMLCIGHLKVVQFRLNVTLRMHTQKLNFQWKCITGLCIVMLAEIFPSFMKIRLIKLKPELAMQRKLNFQGYLKYFECTGNCRRSPYKENTGDWGTVDSLPDLNMSQYEPKGYHKEGVPHTITLLYFWAKYSTLLYLRHVTCDRKSVWWHNHVEIVQIVLCWFRFVNMHIGLAVVEIWVGEVNSR